MAKKYLFVFILALQCNISAYIFAQKLPKIFQKPVTQLPDTNKKKPTENLLNLKEKADFMPKFLPIHFDFLAEIAPQNPQDSTQKQNITQKNQQENRKNAFASRTQIGVGNYGNSLIKNRTESPVLWENWRFFAEIFYQNSKYGAVARKASGNHFFHTQIGAEFAKNYKHKYLKVTTYILVKNHENRFYNYKPELLSNNNADTLVQRFVQNSFHLSFLYVDTIKKQTLEGEIKLQSWQKLPNQNISKVTERTSGFRLKYNKKLHTDKNKNKNIFYRFIQQLEFTSTL